MDTADDHSKRRTGHQPTPDGGTCPFEFRRWWHNAGSGADVMSVLERYSDLDCSVLLGCARRDVIAARIRGLQQIEMQSTFVLVAG